MKLLSQRIDNLSEAVVAQIELLRGEQLERLGDRVLSCLSLQALIRYFSDSTAR